jgi:hypothetical protein
MTALRQLDGDVAKSLSADAFHKRRRRDAPPPLT